MRTCLSARGPAGEFTPQKPPFQLRPRRVAVKKSKTPKKDPRATPVRDIPVHSPIMAPGRHNITIEYAKRLEQLITAPMAEENEVWRETIVRSKPNTGSTFGTPRSVRHCTIEKGECNRNSENRDLNVGNNALLNPK